MIVVAFCMILEAIKPPVTLSDQNEKGHNEVTYTIEDTRIYTHYDFNCQYNQKIRRSPDPYKFISYRHTAASTIITKGYKAVIYWKRIRSRTWTTTITPIHTEAIIILIFIL